MGDNNILEVQGISIYLREGKYYWMVKSCAFDSVEEAAKDAVKFCERNTNHVKTNEKTVKAVGELVCSLFSGVGIPVTNLARKNIEELVADAMNNN